MNTNEAIAYFTNYLPLRLCNLCELDGESVSLWCPFDKEQIDPKHTVQIRLRIRDDYPEFYLAAWVRKIRTEYQI